MATFVPSPDLEARLLRLLAPKVRAAGQEVKAFLTEKLSGPGSGVQWPGQPNPSSAPGEYPAEQSGDLVGSLDAREVGPLHWQAGAFEAPPEAFWLEFPPPPGSPFAKKTGYGARPWISKAFNDAELHARILQSLR